MSVIVKKKLNRTGHHHGFLRVCGVVLSTPNYESVGLGFSPSVGSRDAAHLAVHFSVWLVDKWVPGETWGKVSCGNLHVTLGLGSRVVGSYASQAEGYI